MFLKNKKLRGMSLVELLAYTVILSIVTTALFQLIHFIQDMNEKDLKQQEIYSEFNLALIKLETFMSQSTQANLFVSDSCMQNSQESFYFVKDSSSSNYSLCKTRAPICNVSPQVCDERLSKDPIFKTDGKFFSELPSSTGLYKGVKYNFYILKPELVMNFTSFTRYE
jgi:Tfp pilus assembly protein PilV